MMDGKGKKALVRFARKKKEEADGCGPALKGWVAMEEWESLGKRRKKALVKKYVNKTRPWMERFFAPVLELIKLKRQQMEKAEEAADKLGEWLSDQAAEWGKDREEAEAELDVLEKNLKAAQAPMSFLTASPEQRELLRRAADYTDEWWQEADSCFRAYYVCMAGRGADWHTGKPTYCGTLTVSSHWTRMFEDPLADKQRWYCPECTAKYKASFGYLLELVCGGETLYVRALHHDKICVQDFKAQMVERAHGRGVSMGKALLELIPEVHPVGSPWMMKTALEGTYRFDQSVFEKLPLWDWMTFLRLAK